MTLSQKIAAALDETRCALIPPCLAQIQDGENSVSLDLTSLDSVGLAFRELEFVTKKPTEWTTDRAKAWGNNLASRVTYLMEPLVLLEVDDRVSEVQLRSQSPTLRSDKRSFYEVRIQKPGVLHLSRVAFDESSRKRTPAPCQMTREVLERLADDLVASIP